jgi:hypothetical protein
MGSQLSKYWKDYWGLTADRLSNGIVEK